jgi:hypothetical protein
MSSSAATPPRPRFTAIRHGAEPQLGNFGVRHHLYRTLVALEELGVVAHVVRGMALGSGVVFRSLQ